MTEQKNMAEQQPGTQKEYEFGDMKYYVYVPDGDPPADGWPILLFTHGVGEATQTYSKNGGGWSKQSLEAVKVHGSPPELCDQKASTELKSFIVVSPQFPFEPNAEQRAKGKRSWQWEQKAANVSGILDSVATTFNGNSEKVYAVGFSKGARGALELSQQLNKGKQRIAKLVLIDSELVPKTTPDIPTWIHHAGPQTLENIAEQHKGLIGKEIWVNAPPGKQLPDGKYLVTNWNLGSQSRTQNHTEACRLACSDPRVYEWLRKTHAQAAVK